MRLDNKIIACNLLDTLWFPQIFQFAWGSGTNDRYVWPGTQVSRIIPPMAAPPSPPPQRSMIGDEYGVERIACLPASKQTVKRYQWAEIDAVSRIRIRIRIHRIHVFLGLLDPDPDPLVRGMDPDPAPDLVPSIFKQK